MAFTDYTDLLIGTSDYTGRDDVTHLFPRFVKLAESRLNRRLRVGDMEAETQITTDANGEVSLPSDFLEMREVKNSVGRILKSNSLNALTRSYGNRGGTPEAYAVVGTEFHVKPKGAATFDITYYQDIPSLTANSTNWLLTRAPDVYLAAVSAQVLLWASAQEGGADNAQRLDAANALYDETTAQLIIDDERARFGNAAVRLSGHTP